LNLCVFPVHRYSSCFQDNILHAAQSAVQSPRPGGLYVQRRKGAVKKNKIKLMALRSFLTMLFLIINDLILGAGRQADCLQQDSAI